MTKSVPYQQLQIGGEGKNIFEVAKKHSCVQKLRKTSRYSSVERVHRNKPFNCILRGLKFLVFNGLLPLNWNIAQKKMVWFYSSVNILEQGKEFVKSLK